LSGLGIDYARSPIVDGGGQRFFEDTVRGGKGIGSRFLLLGGSRENVAGTEAARGLANSLSDIVELRVMDRDGTTLVRPDGYVAYSAHHAMGAAELNSVRALLAHQTR
jgi:hypothetical protein